MTTSRGASVGHMIVAGAAAIFLAIGSIGPWITLGVISRNGLDGGSDGWLTLAGAALAAVALWRYFTLPQRGQGWWLALEGAAAAAVGIYDINSVQSRHASVFGVDISPSPGWGLYLAVASGIVLALVGVSIARTTPPRSVTSPAAAPPAA